MTTSTLTFAGEGAMRALLRAHDWSGFALGPPTAWPGPLKTVIQLMLDCRRPSCLAWGPQLHLFYNDAYMEVLGEKHPSALARPFWDVWPELRQDLGPAVARALKGEPSLQKNMPFQIMRQGFLEPTLFIFSLLPVRDDEGQVAGLFSLGMETTEQVQAEQSQRFLLALTDGLRPLDEPDRITALACEMLGRHLKASRVFYCEVDHLQRTFFIRSNWVRQGLDSVAGETRRLDDYGPQIIDMLYGAQPVAINDIAQDPRTAPYAQAYRRIGLRAYLAIPLIKSNRLISLLSVHSDVPRRWSRRDRYLCEQLIERTWAAAQNAHAQAQLRTAVDKLKMADAQKDEFLAMLGHELRNPLAPIRSAAELLMRAKLDEGEVRQTSEIIARQVDHMTVLIDDLLDVSRVTRGLIELEKTPLDMRRIVQDAVEQVDPLIRSRHHHLALHLTPEVTTVMGDEKRLVQVVANLLNNAAKYTPQGGHLVLRTELHDQKVVLSVMDDGIGMEPELASRVFELFAQAERTPDRASGGLGLGLALVKSLVELHGGGVTGASIGPGKGSTFTVSLPRLPVQAERAKGQQAA
ncbi:ATP-binding protein (plasmid) [Polaromonas hydrogenivorans]|uniref:histidine kinase n=1 Tax=Polaromonas hydrogenivorans TaxID=335476 RepID=A0AAU7LZV4_9BURK